MSVMCKDIKYCSNEMLKYNKIRCVPADHAKIVEQLSYYIEYMLFNMITVVCIISFSVGVNKLFDSHMNYLQVYVDKRCSMQKKPRQTNKTKQRGGVFNTATFFGQHESQYSAANSTADVMQANIQAGLARPALFSTLNGQQGGGSKCARLDKYIVRKINSIFRFFKLSTEKNVALTFLKLFNKYMSELFTKIKKSCKTELTAQKLERVLSRTKIMQ